MRFAALGNRGISTLTGLLLFGWSVAATAQSATPDKTKTTAGSAPGTTESPGAAPATPAKAAPAAPKATHAKPSPAKAPESKPDPGKSEQTAPAVPAAPADAASSAAPAAAGAGEPWTKTPAGQPSPAAANPTSPWAEGAAKPANAAPPVYYVEQQPNAAQGAAQGAAPGSAPPNGERPPAATAPNATTPNAIDPMQLHVDEPPPPPAPRHVAPRTALWLGARVGFFIPFGDLWGRCSSDGYSSCDRVDGTKFSDVAASGPLFELDAGVRLGRNYVIYLAWERAQLGAADGPSPDPNVAATQSRAESDFFALGVRLSADPDDVGLLLDLAIGARRFQGFYEGGNKLQLSDAPMESRLGIGVDFRTNRYFALSPMITLGLGSFGKADWVQGNTIRTGIPSDSDRLTHGWVSLQLGGHFDVFGGS